MKTIITCAITGGATDPNKTPYLPITPEEIANSSLEAAAAGAAIVHLHVRDPKTKKPSMDLELYRETVERIREKNSDVLINLTTGPGAVFFFGSPIFQVAGPGTAIAPPQKRVQHVLDLKPDICSVDFNCMHQANGGIRVNHKSVLTEMLRLIREAGVKPELELFDSGDMRIAREFYDSGAIEDPPFWQFAMGVPYGWPDTPTALTHAHAMLPGSDSIWSAFGLGRQEMKMVAMTYCLGGHVRVGMEDNIYLRRGVLAERNSQLVEQAVKLIGILGGDIATPSDAREILKLPPK